MADQKLSLEESGNNARQLLRALPPGIWALGLSAMFMDMSSELVHSLLPMFMASVLGASMLTIGFLEGVAEATAAITKIFSGALSDYLGKRKFLVVLGYGLAAVTKPVFPLAPSIAWVFGARFIDRIGKGIRGAPRDALVADITPPELRGAAYGLRQSLDSVGAFLGPLLAIAFMALWANDIKAVLWVAVLPAFISVGLVFSIREPVAQKNPPQNDSPIALSSTARLDANYWIVVVFGAVFTLARFSEAFLVLRAQSVGLSIGLVPMIMIVMNLVYAASAYPAGIASDHLSQRLMLVTGLAMLVLAELLLAFAAAPWQVFAGAGLWGLHMGFTQGLFNKLVANAAPTELRATAFGIFNLTSGISLLVASIIAGLLWQMIGPQATFLGGAAFAALAAIGVLTYRANPAVA
ncbi:MAG TPA: MFS transporter [Candidatus Binatia bacterium]|nr:MFS transporter [Candidatus Binatia bacterium]